MGMTVRRATPDDREWVRALVREHWADDFVLSLGQVFRPDEQPGFIAEQGGERAGLLAYNIEGDTCEIVALAATQPGGGVGTRLIEAVREAAVEAGCRRLRLITTNDNVDALRFYQRRGFVLTALHRNEIEAFRQIKPGIPETGFYGIPIRDVLELEQVLPAHDVPGSG